MNASSALVMEEAVLGCLLLDNASFISIKDQLVASDFQNEGHRRIYAAISELAEEGSEFDAVTVAEYLDRRGHLEIVGGLTRLTTLSRETATAANISQYAQSVRDRGRLIKAQKIAWQLAKVRDPADLAGYIDALSALTDEADAGVERYAVTARHIGEIIAKPTCVRWLPGLHKKLERGVIAILAGPRGSYKSSVALQWSLDTARHGITVLIVAAEGAGSDRRVQANLKKFGGVAAKLSLYMIERRVDFNSAQGIDAVLEEIERLRITPELIVIDTLSKNSGGLDENSNTEVKQFIGRIDTDLRTRLGCTVLLVAHTGHGHQSRVRGASAIEADTDAAYIVTKVSEKAITVSRNRFKDAPEMEPLNYSVEVQDLGYKDDHGEAVTSCVLVSSELVPVKRQPNGKCQRQLLAELEKRISGSDLGVWTEGELREIARELGMQKSSARAAVHGLRELGYFLPSVGGSKLAFTPSDAGQKDKNRDKTSFCPRSDGDKNDKGSKEPVFCPLTSSQGGINP